MQGELSFGYARRPGVWASGFDLRAYCRICLLATSFPGGTCLTGWPRLLLTLWATYLAGHF